MTTSAPDWCALVEECGARPVYVETLRDGGCNIRFDGVEFTIAVRHGRYWHVNRGKEYVDDPAVCIRTALNHLRAELRARIERDTAALARLGGSNV